MEAIIEEQLQSEALNPLRVLVAEDNRADLYLIRQAFSRVQANCELIALEDGDEVLQYLLRAGQSEDVPLPDIIVLDMNLPKREGSELLRVIRNHPTLRHVTVAVVSSSPEEVALREPVQADCYIRKPSRLDEYLAIGKEILDCYRSVRRKACGA